jgi:hypothetical protein
MFIALIIRCNPFMVLLMAEEGAGVQFEAGVQFQAGVRFGFGVWFGFGVGFGFGSGRSLRPVF